MGFAGLLIDSFILLKRCPRFFIPKILIAFFFFPIFILLPYYLLEVNIMSPQDIARVQAQQLITVMLNLIFILVYTFLVYVIDSFIVNPMYPVLVQQYYKAREINFSKAFLSVIRRFGTIFPAVLAVAVLVFVAMFPFLFIMISAVLLENDFLFFIAIITAFLSIFIVFILFYLLYPISSLENFDFLKIVRQTVKASLKHKGDIAKAFLISFSISGVSYLLGFVIAGMNDPSLLAPKMGVFFIFILVRILIAIFTTYQYVLNSVLYFGLEKGVFLGK